MKPTCDQPLDNPNMQTVYICGGLAFLSFPELVLNPLTAPGFGALGLMRRICSSGMAFNSTIKASDAVVPLNPPLLLLFLQPLGVFYSHRHLSPSDKSYIEPLVVLMWLRAHSHMYLRLCVCWIERSCIQIQRATFMTERAVLVRKIDHDSWLGAPPSPGDRYIPQSDCFPALPTPSLVWLIILCPCFGLSLSCIC